MIKTYTEYREHDGTYKLVARRLSLATLNKKCAAAAYYLSFDSYNPSKGFFGKRKIEGFIY